MERFDWEIQAVLISREFLNCGTLTADLMAMTNSVVMLHIFRLAQRQVLRGTPNPYFLW